MSKLIELYSKLIFFNFCLFSFNIVHNIYFHATSLLSLGEGEPGYTGIYAS